ncbi:MAG: class I SAM-dependent methyltransferase, partial [Gammaproteobacteria bacterium]|nr:class I SAM-dependent methyltransferase [Gammaproteobacteria bacterium]
MSANMDFEKKVAAHETHRAGTDYLISDNPARISAGKGLYTARSAVTALDRWIAAKMLGVVGNPAITLKLWNGEAVTPPIENPVATLQYHSRGAMLKTIINPELYFGDLYACGQVSFSGDLVRFTEMIYTNLEKIGRGGWLRSLILKLGHRRIANSHEKAKDNIHHHYDIGNDFYRLWLDTEQMQYTCAYFPDPAMTLEQAQTAKLHHVCRKLQLKPGDKVVEAGCGWGGLALFMAR